MRICYLADAGSIHTRRWVSCFARRGHEVYLISIRAPAGPAPEDVELKVLKRLGPEIRLISFPVHLAANTVQVRRLLARLRPDILHAHYVTGYGFVGALAGYRPFVLTARGSDLLAAPRMNPVWGFLTRFALRRADRVICVSAALKEEAIRLGAARDRVEVSPTGVDTRKFSPDRADSSLLTELRAVDSQVVISTRSLKPVYDVETLVRAVPLVLKEVPEALFVIAGDGELRGRLESLARDLRVHDSVRFVGWAPHDEIPRYLASSDVYVSTSLSDGTSNSLLEAMACGIAPAVTDIPANTPWVRDGENGLLFPTGDYEALAARLVQLLTDRERRQAFGTAGRDLARDKGDQEKAMSRTEDMYRELMAAGPRPR